MATGTVRSFNYSKGYGFIQIPAGGGDVFVHSSAVRRAGLAGLRIGQKMSFEIFDHQGKPAAENLHINEAAEEQSGHDLILAKMEQKSEPCHMNQKKLEQSPKKRTWITRTALEATLVESVRASDPKCEGLIGIIVERVVSRSSDVANWAVKGVKYGRAEREPCSAAVSKCVEESQREFEVLDWS